MSLATRCPVCGTAFRVHREQLAALSGKVRCGKCATVFDGVAALIEHGAEKLALEPSPQLGLFDPSRRGPAAGAEQKDAPLPPFMADERPRTRLRWIWATAALVATLALGVQAGHRYRAELAALAPWSRPALQSACRLLRCEVSLPRRLELLTIESSDLQLDVRRDGLMILNAVLRNRARFPQDYPALELTLTDEGDRPVLRRVIAPSDYLSAIPGSPVAEQGIAPGGEASFRLYIDPNRARAIGYRLYLFYPS
jgi:predicted Zn finger-like uncharacterized protein